MEERMDEEKKATSDLTEEFRRLGENLKDAIESAWESEERKNLTDEIRDGLVSATEAVEKAAKDIVESPTAVKVREDVDDFTERVRSGEVTDQFRHEILRALQKINEELEDVFTSSPKPSEDSADDGGN
jgi:ElaB/YqjD/DUF883 family membrane-anchored ribosome-binding protein